MEGSIAEYVLLAAGVSALLIVILYIKRKDSAAYKAMVLIGMVAGAAAIYMAAINYGEWTDECVVICIVAGYAMVIRPFKNVDFAVVLGILAVLLAYAYLGEMTGDLEGLSHGTPRIIVAILAGSIVYMVFNFITKAAIFIGKVLNWWPFLFIIGVLCVAEAALIMSGSGTIVDLYNKYCGSGSDNLASLAALKSAVVSFK